MIYQGKEIDVILFRFSLSDLMYYPDFLKVNNNINKFKIR